jgi:SPFH domain / Band 7 family
VTAIPTEEQPEALEGPRSNGDPDDIDALGAAPTLPAGGARAAARRRVPRAARVMRKGGRFRWPILVVVLIIALALAPMGLSSLKKTPRNMVGISYGGGPVEAAHFQRIVQPGSGLFFNGAFDPLYLYPADTQTYIVSKVPGEGAVEEVDSIASPSRDRVQVEYQIAAYFKLNTDRLRDFHETLGLQYRAYRSNGWNQLIQDTFRQQIENALQENTRQYDVADIYGNADALTTIQSDVEEKVSDRLVAALGQPFFCGPTFEPGGTCTSPTFIIKKIDIPEDVANAFEDNRTSQVRVLTSQNEIAQRAAEAQAIKALNEGLAEAGMPYVLLKAIESGKIDFWVLPSDSGVTLQGPDSTPPTTAPGG